MNQNIHTFTSVVVSTLMRNLDSLLSDDWPALLKGSFICIRCRGCLQITWQKAGWMGPGLKRQESKCRVIYQRNGFWGLVHKAEQKAPWNLFLQLMKVVIRELAFCKHCRAATINWPLCGSARVHPCLCSASVSNNRTQVPKLTGLSQPRFWVADCQTDITSGP